MYIRTLGSDDLRKIRLSLDLPERDYFASRECPYTKRMSTARDTLRSVNSRWTKWEYLKSTSIRTTNI